MVRSMSNKDFVIDGDGCASMNCIDHKWFPVKEKKKKHENESVISTEAFQLIRVLFVLRVV